MPAPTYTVYLEDVDALGMVYHANYLKYAERARSEWLRARGASHALMLEAGQARIIVSELAIIYRSPARLEDVLAVDTEIINIGAASAKLRQVVWREKLPIAELTLTLVCVDVTGRPCRWPQEVRMALDGHDEKDT